MTINTSKERGSSNLTVVKASLSRSKSLLETSRAIVRVEASLVATTADTKTLIHEIAYEQMHRSDDRLNDRILLELEAESSAYMVAEHFGLEGLARPNYVALHCADAEMILAHIERIRNMAAEIIQALEVEPELAY